MINHTYLTPELYDIYTRQYLLNRLSNYFANGYNDPELLYLGARYAISLGLFHQAKRFLNPLGDLFKKGESFGLAYFPTGLLSVCARMKSDSNPAVYDWLKKIDSSFPSLEALTQEDIASDAKVLEEIYQRHTGSDQPWSEAEDVATIEDMNQQLENLNQEVAQIQKNNQDPLLEKSSLLHKLGVLGFIAYDADQLAISRQALELILTIDGDRPEVLRNLVNITGELEDIEAYERYWTRYVNIQLWRVCRDDAPHIAWQDLFLFYSKVASVTDRECSKTIEKTAKILSRPGFIHRWLEAHSALIWLNSTANGLVSHPTETDTSSNSGSNAFRHLIMAKWCDTFYPSFSNILSPGHMAQALPGSLGLETMEMSFLSFSPETRMIQRLLQWSECQFGLSDNATEKQHQTITALVEFSAIIPTWYYSKDNEILSWASEKSRIDGSLHQEVTKICSMFLNSNLGKFLENQDWSGLIENFDPECFHHLSSSTILFVALAYMRTENPQPEMALKTACRSLSNMIPKDLEKDSQALMLWQQIIFAWLSNISYPQKALILHLENADNKEVIQNAFEEAQAALTKDNKFEKARIIIRSLPDDSKSSKEFKENTINQINKNEGQYKKQLSNHIEKIKTDIEKINIVSTLNSFKSSLFSIFQACLSMKTEEFQLAEKEIKSLPDKPEVVAAFKVSFLSDIEQAEQQVLIRDMIDEAIEASKAHMQKGNFTKARDEIKALPDESEELKGFKSHFLEQIDEVEESYVDHDLINTTIESTKADVQEGRFNDARQKIRDLPDKPEQILELKQNFLKQIGEQELIQTVIERTTEEVQKGEFKKAKLTAYSLPEKPAQIRELKQNLLKQIAEAEENYVDNAMIERTIEKAKAFVQKNEFDKAKSTVRSLPNKPAQIKELKQNFLGQINEAQENHKKVFKESSALLKRITDRGVKIDVITEIAKENNVDIGNVYQFYELLKAIERKL